MARIAHDLGGYGMENQAEILRGDYSHVSEEDVPFFEAALAESRGQA